MAYDSEEEGYRVEVKHRALPPSPYKWEIYEGSNPMWTEQSKITFKSHRKAEEAGNEALRKLLERNSKDRSDD